MRDIFPGGAQHALCLHGFAPKDSGQWETVYELLLRCHDLIGAKPDRVTLDDVPGLSDEARSIESWEKWRENNLFPTPSSLSVSANVFRGIVLPWLHTRSWGSANNGLGSPIYCGDERPVTIDGGAFKFFCDAALYRSAFSVFDKMALDAWSCIRFEYGYAFTNSDPLGFCMGGLRSNFPADLNALRRRWSEFRHQTPEGCVYSEWMDKQQGVPSRRLTPGPRYSERLRDVFPLNYLVATHLSLPVGNSTLGGWIEQDAARGTLSQLADGLWCWSVDERAIPAVRRSLEPRGLLVAPGGR
ncbi:MAG: hypothetical protein ACK4K3_07240 [Aquabacterium sp.]